MKPKRILTAIVTTLVAFGWSAFTAPAANASYPEVLHVRVQWLTNHPQFGGDPSAFSRSITLAAGCYHWNLWWAGSEVYPRNLYLAADTYTWEEDLTPWTDSLYRQGASLSTPGGRFAHNPYDAWFLQGAPDSYSQVAWGSSLLWYSSGPSC
ncbi:hypothetical protein [Amycolatopsis sp.]|uniref:hypothetical protein n=1 Tax=Amycolatopsis sp. TaxID=37632 RepID=UPI002C0F13B1|nr:hypothetical protein [Amycolatopsis sp.]HVV12439.1 hypothetical protein [Amycolatopsis sp.]